LPSFAAWPEAGLLNNTGHLPADATQGMGDFLPGWQPAQLIGVLPKLVALGG
jgi:hypothetical protein